MSILSLPVSIVPKRALAGLLTAFTLLAAGPVVSSAAADKPTEPKDKTMKAFDGDGRKN